VPKQLRTRYEYALFNMCVLSAVIPNMLLQVQESTEAAIEERGATQREIAEMKMNLELAGTKSEEAIAAAAAQRAELEAVNASLLAAQQREASLQQQTELSALELTQERETASAAAAAGELRTEQLIEELDLLKRSKASNSDDAEAAHSTIKELRMRLVSAEEESGKPMTRLASHTRLSMDM
jgi:hypothetical protein